MPVLDNGFLDWAINRHEILNEHALQKFYPQRNTGAGITLHSAAGYRPGNEGEMLKPPSVRKFSMQGDIEQSGEAYMYYPVWTSTWTSSSRLANTTTWGWEVDGGVSKENGGPGVDEPLTKAQIKSIKRLIEDWELETGNVASRVNGEGYSKTMHEHREWYSGTSCPNGRMDVIWDWVELRKKPDVSTIEERLAALERRAEKLEAQLVSLNDAEVKRWDIVELASRDIETVRRAYEHLKRGDDFLRVGDSK